MTERSSDLIKDVLVDSELAKNIVPNKFKHTSKQGRARRQKLLMAAKKLSETRDIQDISLADVCEKAGIPRASAYHFFPNVESIFLALRFLSYIETFKALEKIEVHDFKRWEDYLAQVIRQSGQVFNNDVTKNKLMYGANTPEFQDHDYDERIDINMVGMIVGKLSDYYDMSSFEDIDDLFLIAYGIIHSIFALSFKQFDEITAEMCEETIKASVAYLRCYLPEHLPRR